MTGICFTRACRRKAKLKMAITGTSGSGKTYSALLIARGLAGPEGRIAVADTENRSAELYSHLTGFDTCIITAPYSVGKYLSVIRAAEESGYDVLILDSVTPVWKGSGGLLERQELEAETNRNKFGSWRNVSHEYRELIEAIVTAKIHIIATLRSQTAWDMDAAADTGRKVPVKIGLKPEMREGFDYEFTTVLNMNLTQLGHMATVSKDRTGIFDGRGPFVPDQHTGEILHDWLESGTGTAASPPPVPAVPAPMVPVPTAPQAPAAEKKPARLYSQKEFAAIQSRYLQEGWDTAVIVSAKCGDDIFDRDAIDADYRMRTRSEPADDHPLFHCDTCGADVAKAQHDVSLLFLGKCLCKQCMGK